MLVLSDQRTQISGTPSGSLDDSQPVSKDIYNPPTEAISDEDVPESFEKYFRSTEAHSKKDILSEDLKQKKLIYPESVRIYITITDIYEKLRFSFKN